MDQLKSDQFYDTCIYEIFSLLTERIKFTLGQPEVNVESHENENPRV